MISLNIIKTFGRLGTRYTRHRHDAGRFYLARTFHRCCVVSADVSLTTPQPSNVSDKQFPEKLHTIVNDISKLTLLEVAELNQLLKRTLNIPDAPMMAMGAFNGNMGAGATDKDEEQQSSSKVKSSFTVKLTKFDETKKIQLIKEVKNVIEGLNLVQAKKFVESLPQVVMADVSKDDADKLQKALEAAGGIIAIE